jgi:hypothetical protein
VDPDVAETQQPYYYAADDPVNETDLSGDYTVGVCGGASLALGLGFNGNAASSQGGQASVCLQRTVFTPSGNDDIVFTETTGTSTGSVAGIEVGVSLGYQISNANSLSELGKGFTEDSVSVGSITTLFSIAESAFYGTASDGRDIWGVNISATLGLGDATAQYKTWTNVQHVTNPIEANALRLYWDTVLPVGFDNQLTIEGILAAARSLSNVQQAPTASPSSIIAVTC